MPKPNAERNVVQTTEDPRRIQFCTEQCPHEDKPCSGSCAEVRMFVQGGYVPLTKQQLSSVKPRRTTMVTYDGREMTLRELADETGINAETLRFRLKNHTPEEAVAMGQARAYGTNSEAKKVQEQKPETQNPAEPALPDGADLTGNTSPLQGEDIGRLIREAAELIEKRDRLVQENLRQIRELNVEIHNRVVEVYFIEQKEWEHE